MTDGADGSPHIAPMGPVVNPELTNWLLRPYQSSNTFRLLRQNPVCVFHVIDDVLMVVRAILDMPLDAAANKNTSGGWVLESACHWYCLRVVDWNLDQPRSEATAVVLSSGSLRPFWGWNRAKHAILEAAILVTRLERIDEKVVVEEFSKLAVIVSKTAGPNEFAAWQLLEEHLTQHVTNVSAVRVPHA